MVDKAKQILLYIVAPIAAIAAYILYLLRKVSGLKADLAVKNAESKTAKEREKVNETETKAKDSVSDFTRLWDEYRKGGPGV